LVSLPHHDLADTFAADTEAHVEVLAVLLDVAVSDLATLADGQQVVAVRVGPEDAVGRRATSLARVLARTRRTIHRQIETTAADVATGGEQFLLGLDRPSDALRLDRGDRLLDHGLRLLDLALRLAHGMTPKETYRTSVCHTL